MRRRAFGSMECSSCVREQLPVTMQVRQESSAEAYLGDHPICRRSYVVHIGWDDQETSVGLRLSPVLLGSLPPDRLLLLLHSLSSIAVIISVPLGHAGADSQHRQNDEDPEDATDEWRQQLPCKVVRACGHNCTSASGTMKWHSHTHTSQPHTHSLVCSAWTACAGLLCAFLKYE